MPAGYHRADSHGAASLSRRTGFTARKLKRISAAKASHNILGAAPGTGLVSGELPGVAKFPGDAAGLGRVVMVSVDTADVAPGVTVGGLKEQLVSAGRPVQASVMGFVYAPPTAEIVAA